VAKDGTDRKSNQQTSDRIDDRCIMIALHQPTATDLRFITAAMKINSDLERIADKHQCLRRQRIL